MAMPPTHLYRFIKGDPKATFYSLRKNGLLRWKVVAKPERFLESIKHAQKTYKEDDSGMVGPNLDDVTAAAAGQFLGRTGELMNSQIIFRSSKSQEFMFWVLLQMCRVKSLFYYRKKV